MTPWFLHWPPPLRFTLATLLLYLKFPKDFPLAFGIKSEFLPQTHKPTMTQPCRPLQPCPPACPHPELLLPAAHTLKSASSMGPVLLPLSALCQIAKYPVLFYFYYF